VKTVLFLCTGNHYRGRFAEESFNHEAERVGLDWIAPVTRSRRGTAAKTGNAAINPAQERGLFLW
jgi:protein-tyrosine phosphatase